MPPSPKACVPTQTQLCIPGYSVDYIILLHGRKPHHLSSVDKIELMAAVQLTLS